MEFFLPRVSPKYKLFFRYLLLPCKILPNFQQVFPVLIFPLKPSLHKTKSTSLNVRGMTLLLYLAAIFLFNATSLKVATSHLSSMRSSSILRFPSFWFRFKFVILKAGSPISIRMTASILYAILNGVSLMAK